MGSGCKVQKNNRRKNFPGRPVSTYLLYARDENPPGGFIFPRNEKENGTDENKTFELKGFGGTIYTFGLEIPLNPQSPEDFAEKMQESEAELMERINRTVFRL